MRIESFTYRWRISITFSALLLGWAAALFSQPSIVRYSTLDRITDCSGYLLLIGGILIRTWASREISGRESQAIVETGPYALCRNPLCCGSFLLAVSQFMFLKSPCFLLAIAILIIVYSSGVVPAEEHTLSLLFSDTYRNYCRAVPRWWPRWNAKAWTTIGPADFDADYREKLSMIGYLGVPFAAELIRHYRELPDWPHWPFPFV